MGRTVRFPRRDRRAPRDRRTLRRRRGPPPDGPRLESFADKLQILVLTRPIAAREVEKLIDRLLAPKPPEP
jgi:hypothetical protein